MSKDVELKLRQERGVFGVEAGGCAVEVEEEELEGRLEFQPSVGSGRGIHSLEPACVLYTGTRWFSVHVEWNLRQERGVSVLKPMDVLWKLRKRSIMKVWNFSHRLDLVVAGAAWNPPVIFTSVLPM